MDFIIIGKKEDIELVRVLSYNMPTFKNNKERKTPYGRLKVSVRGEIFVCPIKEDGDSQYITAKRKRYYLRNIGSLDNPIFEFYDREQKTFIQNVETLDRNVNFRDN